MGASEASTVAPPIFRLFRIPERYLRSVHLERDFDDATALRHYVITPPMASVFAKIVQGLQPGSGRRAWRITGDYGTGKSSFALMLAQLLRAPSVPLNDDATRTLTEALTDVSVNVRELRIVPILVTGAREALVPAIARGVGRALQGINPSALLEQEVEVLSQRAIDVISRNDVATLLELLELFRHLVSRSGYSGVLLVLDELGKFLEYASLHPDKEDVYVLQRLAETAARSGKSPFILLGLLHQGFHAYAERLPSASRQEWEKVAGRFEEITFDQPLGHVAALVEGALSIDTGQLPQEIVATIPAVLHATQITHWYGTSLPSVAPLSLYPLHPTVLPVLARFFAQFGQHERSLFSFLLSSEPFGLQDFATQPATARTWYRLADFYDYVRSVFGYRLAGTSYRSYWLRISETVTRATDIGLSELELQVLKVVALLNVLDAEHLLPTSEVLKAVLSDGDLDSVVAVAVTTLKRRGLLFHRGTADSYRLWPSTSVNLESAFEKARRALGPVDQVSPQLTPYLDATSIVARRHYVKTGTFRYFAVYYTELAKLEDALAQETEADGMIVVALCETSEERQAALDLVAKSDTAKNPALLVAVPPPLQFLATELQDARCWQWVADHTPELSQDSYAAAEVARQLAATRRTLQHNVATHLGFLGDHQNITWWRSGKQFTSVDGSRLSTILSALCDELYDEAPLIRNELLNRRTISSAATAARFRLMQQMFTAPDQPGLGIALDKAPPEKSMYLSVLQAGNIHREEDGHFKLALPPQEDDPLRLRPSLTKILDVLERAEGGRIPVSQLIALLQERPYGVRMGVVFLLLAVVAAAYSHRIAVYERGTFMRRFEASDFMRLMKQPSAFDFQYCSIEGVRADVFSELARVFARKRDGAREPELLDVVIPLSTFAAQLPEYTRKHTSLPDMVTKVRDALLSAREPSTLLFETLPQSCGFEPFTASTLNHNGQALQFVAELQGAIGELRSIYPQLLGRINEHIALALKDSRRLDRESIALRASQVVLAAREPRVQTFARCLADTVLSDDAWAVRIGSFVISKPPMRWTVADERRALDDIDALLATFKRVEATAFLDVTPTPDSTAIRLLVTQADGWENYVVVRTSTDKEAEVTELVNKLEAVLAENDALRLNALAQLIRSSIIETESTS